MSEDTMYTFTSKGLGPGKELTVVDFKSFSAISKLYEYTLTLKSESPDLDMAAMLRNPCTFTINLNTDTEPVHGVLSDFCLQRQVGKYFLYQAVLVPRIWQLSLYHTNEVYLDMTVQEIIETLVAEGGLSALDYKMNLQKDYKKWDFRCQFGETHLQFLSRLMEYEGIYYYFEQGEDVEKIIFCDSLLYHIAMDEPDLHYQPASGLDLTSAKDSLFSFVCRQKRMPRKVVLKDYDYQYPLLDVKGEAPVDENGIGEVFIYGENFDTPLEGDLLAQVRAQEISCTKEENHGESVVSRLNPGYLFSVAGHFRKEYNRQYLLTVLEQEGVSPSHMTGGGGSENRPAYRNTFTAIPSTVQFRPERITTKPKFYGTINAVIGAEGSGDYAELDEYGRYKVVLPFDRVIKNEGKASHWIRMASPYSGKTEGMHFPLRKNTEVLLTFINGDPDQPIIASAVPNAAQPNVVTGENQSNSVLKSASGNLFEMEDKDGSNRLKLSSPGMNSYLHLGASNHPGDGIVAYTEGLHRIEVGGGYQHTFVTNPEYTSMATAKKVQDASAYNTGNTYAVAAKANFQSKNYKCKSAVAAASAYSTTTDYIVGALVVNTSKRYKCNTTIHDETAWAIGSTYASGDFVKHDVTSGSFKRYKCIVTAATVGTFIATEWFEEGALRGPFNASHWDEVNPANDDTHWELVEDLFDEQELFTFQIEDADGKPITTAPTSRSATVTPVDKMVAEDEYDGNFLIDRHQGDQYKWSKGNEYIFNFNALSFSSTALTGSTPSTNKKFIYGNSYTVTHKKINETASTKNTKHLIDTMAGFAPPNAFDYDTDAKANTASDSANWQALLQKGHVTVGRFDTFTMQEGNIYDFGGYWNYSLGNSYAEDHINQGSKAVLNTKNDQTWLSSGAVGGAGEAAVGMVVGAVIGLGSFFLTMGVMCGGFAATPVAMPFILAGLALLIPFIWHACWSGADRFSANIGDVIGGPGSGSGYIETWAKRVGSSFTDPTDNNSAQTTYDHADKQDSTKRMHMNSTWVQKNFGDSYDFKKGNSIDINIGHTESHQRGDTYEFVYGGFHEEAKYNGKGIQVHWEKKGGGTSSEATFDPQTGAPLSFEFKNRNYVNFDFNLQLPSSPKFIVSASIAPLTFKVDASVGMSFNIKASAALDLTMDLSKSMSFLLQPFKALSLEFKQGEISTNIPFFKTKFETVLASQKATEMEAKANELNSILTQIGSGAIKLENKGISIENGALKIM